MAQFGQVCEQGRGEHRPHAGHVSQAFVPSLQMRRIGKQLPHRLVQSSDMLGDHMKARADHVAHHGLVDGVALAGETALLGDQPAPVRGKGAEPAAGGIGRIRSQAVTRGGQIVRDHDGVDGVRLGGLSDGARKAANPGRRQDMHFQTRRMQAVRQPALIAAGGFQPDDRRWPQRGKAPGQRLDLLR